MKRGISVVLVVILLLSLLMPYALAEGAGMTILDATQNEEDLGLEITISSSFENADVLDNYKVMLGGNELTLLSVTASEDEQDTEDEQDVEDEKDTEEEKDAEDEKDAQSNDSSYDSGTSWVFLVDVSTVATDQTGYKVKDTLSSLFGLIGQNDNAALVNTAMAYGPEYLTPDADTLQYQMEKTDVTHMNKSADRLYDAVINSVNFLETNKNAKAFKSLVVLSEGKNKIGSVSLDDVLDRIEASKVAVYTIAYIGSSESRDFGEMAQSSIDAGNGGAAINKDTVGGSTIQAEAASVIRYVERKRKKEAVVERKRKKEAADAAQVVPDTTSETEYIIKTEQPKAQGVDNKLVVSFKEGDLTTSISCTIKQDITYPDSGQDKQTNFFERLISGLKSGDIKSVGIVAGVLVLLALAVMLVIRALRKRKDGENPANYNAGEVVTPPSSVVSQVETAAVTTPATIVDTTQKKRLQLSLREATGQSYRAMLTPEGISVGRQGDNHVVLNSDDKHISRHHFVLKLVNDEVMLESISETNGTFVNGMRVEGPIALRQQDIIRVGRTEMTITWKYV